MAVSVFSLNPAGVPVVQTVLSILSIALVLSVFRALWAAVYNLVAHPLHTVPGPKLWAVSDLPYALCNCSGNSHRRILALHKKYGPVVRVGPNDVVLNHPDAWKELMGHRKSAQGEHAKEPYIMFEAQHSVIGANREDHARIRRAISHGFSAQAMLDQQPIIRKYVDLLIQRLRDHATRRSDEAVEMTTWFNWATFDIIGDLSFGEPFGCLEKTEWHPWVHIIFESFVNLVYLASLKRFPKLFAALMWAAGPTISDTRSKHRKFGHDRITERLALTTERHDFIESLVQRQGEKGLSREEIDETAATLVTAGGETTATALSGAIYYLTTHPEVMQKLDQELHANFESEDDMDLISVQKLTYMLAVLNETLRKFSPLGTGIGRQISEGGDVILGHFFPEKVSL